MAYQGLFAKEEYPKIGLDWVLFSIEYFEFYDKVKEAGKFYLKGKDYIVDDGDILNIRFNV